LARSRFLVLLAHAACNDMPAASVSSSGRSLNDFRHLQSENCSVTESCSVMSLCSPCDSVFFLLNYVFENSVYYHYYIPMA